MGKRIKRNKRYVDLFKFLFTFIFVTVASLSSNISYADISGNNGSGQLYGPSCNGCYPNFAFVEEPSNDDKTYNAPMYTYLYGSKGDKSKINSAYFSDPKRYNPGNAAAIFFDENGDKQTVTGREEVYSKYKEAKWCITLRYSRPNDSPNWDSNSQRFQYNWTRQLAGDGYTAEEAEDIMLSGLKQLNTKEGQEAYKRIKKGGMIKRVYNDYLAKVKANGNNYDVPFSELKTLCSNSVIPEPKCDPKKEDCEPKEKKCDPEKEDCDDKPKEKEKEKEKEKPKDPPDTPDKTIDKITPGGGGKVPPKVPSSGEGKCQKSDYETDWIKQKVYKGVYPKSSLELAMTEYKHIVKPVRSIGLQELFEEKEKTGYIKSAQEQMAEWQATHYEQENGPHKTEYFKQLLKFDGENLGEKIGKAGDIEASKAIIDEAADILNEKLKEDEEHIKNLDKGEDTFPLEEGNKIGLSRGGVFTVTKKIREEKVEMKTQEERKYWVYCTEYYVGDVYTDSEGNTVDNRELRHKWNYKVSKKRIVKQGPKFFYNHSIITDFVPYQSFQIVNVLCAKEDLKAVAKQAEADYGGKIKAKVKEESDYSLLMYTEPLDKWKETTMFTPKNMHARLFYDGKCYNKPRLDPKDPGNITEDPNDKETGSLVCSADPSKAPSGSDGANNKQDQGKPQNSKNKDLFGAQFKDEESDELKEKNSGQFQFFRDNVLREIRSDVWSINDKNGSSEIQIKPTYRTDLVLWEGSTPDPFGKNLEIQVNDQKIDWDKNTKVEEGINEGIDGKFKTGYLKSYDEEINKFKYSATWASEGAKSKEEARPTRMLITYSYDPLIKAIKVESFKMHKPKGSLTEDGYPIINVGGLDDQKIDASCDVFYNDKTDKKPRIGIFPKYSKNDPEKRKYQEGFSDKEGNQEPDKHRNGGKQDEKSNTNNELTVNFVKTSKE